MPFKLWVKKKENNIKTKKDQIGEHENLKNIYNKLRQSLACTSNEIHRRKIKRKSSKREKEIL